MAELVTNLDSPGGNITGTSDAVSAEMIMDLAREITPNIKTIGALYNSSEINSVSVIEDLKEYAKANGLEVVEARLNSSSKAVRNLLAWKTDAVFAQLTTLLHRMPISQL